MQKIYVKGLHLFQTSCLQVKRPMSHNYRVALGDFVLFLWSIEWGNDPSNQTQLAWGM